MEKRIFNQSNTIYRGASRRGYEKSPPSRTQPRIATKYNLGVDVGSSFQTNVNQKVFSYSSGYQQNMSDRSANSPQIRVMSFDRSKIVAADIYPKSTLEDIRIDYVRQVEPKMDIDDRTDFGDFGGNYQTNIQRSPVSNLRNDYQSRSLMSEQTTHRSSLDLDLRRRQRNIRESSPESRVGYRRNSDSFRTSKYGRSPERNEESNSRNGFWRNSPERYRGNNDSFSFSEANITSSLNSRMLKMQPETETVVEPDSYRRREHSPVSSGLTMAERSLGYGSTLSSGITEAERSLRFEPPDTSNFKEFRSANQYQERNSKNRPYVDDKRTSETFQSNNNRKPFTPSENWMRKPTQNIAGLKSGPNISGTKSRPNISGIQPRPNIPVVKRGPNFTGVKTGSNVTGVKPRPNVTGVKPRPNVTGVKPGPNVTGAKPGPNAAQVNHTTKPVISAKQGSTPTRLQNPKRKMNATSEDKNESWKKPKFGSSEKNIRKATVSTEVRTNPLPVAAGKSQVYVQSPDTTIAKNTKKKNTKPRFIEPEDLSKVVLRNFPLQRMTAEQTELAIEALTQEFDNVDDESLRLRFVHCYRHRGTLVLFSKDDEAHEWLSEVVKGFEPWDGAEFRVIRQGSQNFKWAVIALAEFPKKEMTTDQLSDLEKALENKLDEEPDETSPQFVDCFPRRGTLMLAYNGQEDLEWLKNTVQDLQLFEGDQLHIIDITDMPEYNKIEMCVPVPPEDIEKALARLDRQNTGLNTKTWHIMRQRRKLSDTDHTHTLTVSVDDDVIEALKKIDFKPFLNFTRITVVNLGKLRNVPFTVSEYEADLRRAKVLVRSNEDKLLIQKLENAVPM